MDSACQGYDKELRVGRCKRFPIVSEREGNLLRTHHIKTVIVAGLLNFEAGSGPF
jgi:hypothetical protein